MTTMPKFRKKEVDAKRFISFVNSILLLLVLSLAASKARSQDAVVWPSLKLPAGLGVFAVGDQVNVNGLWVRLQGFVSTRPPEEIISAFRETLGRPFVENSIYEKKILGRSTEKFYITIVVEPALSGSKGTIAISDLGTFSKDHESENRLRTKWLDRFPVGSAIVSRLRSRDGGKSAEHLVIVNRHGDALNREALVSLMREDGYVLERETAAGSGKKNILSVSVSNGSTFYFTAPHKEAMAVVTRDGDKTVIVLNLVDMQQGKR
jgi:hypothetical protein